MALDVIDEVDDEVIDDNMYDDADVIDNEIIDEIYQKALIIERDDDELDELDAMQYGYDMLDNDE